MRKNRRISTIALSAALTMALLAGCTNKAVTKESETATEADATEAVKTTSATDNTETTAEESTMAVTTAAVTTTAEDETKAEETTKEQEGSTAEETTGVETGTAEDVSTAALEETTAAPVETTAAPVETTAAPVETTAAPVETTEAPVETTAEPETMTEPETEPVDTSYDVRIVNWWQGEEDAPRTQYEKDLRAYREKIQKDHNFTIHIDNIGGWGESYTLQLSSSITAGDPLGQICVLESQWFPAMMNNNMMRPLDTLPSLNLSKPKWDQGVIAATTYGGHVYGLPDVEDARTRYGVFFNKRLLQEAGYSADALYDFQKNGTWNWSKFEEVFKACTRDVDNDGEIDTWGMTCFCTDYYMAAIYSSGAEFVSKDANGKFVNQTKSALFKDTLRWANDMWQKYAQPAQLDDTWDYFKASFNSGRAAMRVTQEYATSELLALRDEWGFVMFPAPDGQEPITLKSEEVVFIPSSYSTEEADRFAFAYDLYTDPVPGYENSDVWKEDCYPAFWDSRAVDETLVRMRSGKTKECLNDFVEYFNDTIGDGFIWDMATGAITPDEAIQAKMSVWNVYIKEQNNAMKKLKN